jgi:hypothetical protein
MLPALRDTSWLPMGPSGPTAIVTFPDLQSIKVAYILLRSSRLFFTIRNNALFVEPDLQLEHTLIAFLDSIAPPTAKLMT